MASFRNSRVLRILHLLLIFLLLCSVTYGKIIYVDDDAAGANDGTSWDNAYIYLQDALADARGTSRVRLIRLCDAKEQAAVHRIRQGFVWGVGSAHGGSALDAHAEGRRRFQCPDTPRDWPARDACK